MTASGSIFYYRNGLINNSNEYLSLSESADMVTIDIKPDYRNTITSLSNIFQTKSSMTSYQPILSNGSNANGAYILYNNKTKNSSVWMGLIL